MKKYFICLFIIALTYPIQPIYSQREIVSLNDNWLFAGISNPSDNSWESVNIPHTWNKDAYTTRNYKRDTCWYKRPLYIPKEKEGKALYLRFEAVNSLAEVYVNDTLLATHRGGYGAFAVNITDKVIYGSQNQITVKVDNQNKDIPPLSGDFTIFGGIYRDVWLITTEQEHFSLDDYASKGVYIDTDVSAGKAVVKIRGTITRPPHSGKLNIRSRIIDKDGNIISENILPVKKDKNPVIPFQMKGIALDNPELWSPCKPYLYTMEIALEDSKTKSVKDKLSVPFGLRWFSVDAKEGFKLNGKPLKLMGVCRHQDQSHLGIAVSNDIHRRDMQLIKEMGANFVRLAHYQHDDAVLEACDRLGLLVWEEIPVVDIISASPDFSDNAKSALREMIRQHYNHPSVVMWGYMNEAVIQVQYRIKKEGRDEIYKKTVDLAKDLEKILKEEDPSRLSVMAYHGNQIYNEIGLNGIADISGWNLYQGWYENDLNGFDRFVDEENRKYPDRPLIISEFGAGSDRRIQSLNPQVFDFSMQWQQIYLEHYLPAIMKRPFIVGASEWNFIDFSSASRQESMPHINNKGLVYADRTPKDVYYYFQSFLRKDIPVLHIATNDWKKRVAVSGSQTVTQPVKVYTNLENITLSVNGQTLGMQEVVNCNAIWQVQLKEGENRLKVTGTFNGETIESYAGIDITFKPGQLTQANAENLDLGINAGSNCFFTDDKSGFCWLPDKEYTAGSWGYIGGNIFRKTPGRIGTTSDIRGTYNTPLFQTKRENPEAYRFDVPNGIYEITLSFADLYNAPSKEAYDLAGYTEEKQGHNQFNIYINDKIAGEHFSPFAESGNNSAIDKTSIIEVSDGKIIIRFEKLKGNSFINAIKIRKL